MEFLRLQVVEQQNIIDDLTKVQIKPFILPLILVHLHTITPEHSWILLLKHVGKYV